MSFHAQKHCCQKKVCLWCRLDVILVLRSRMSDLLRMPLLSTFILWVLYFLVRYARDDVLSPDTYLVQHCMRKYEDINTYALIYH